MKKTTLKQIKNILENQKQSLLQKNNEFIIDLEGDETDKIQGNMIIEMQTQLDNRNSMKLVQIEEALSRIEKNIFGICRECEDEIAEKRLLINPHVFLCISCAEEKELNSKQRSK